MTTRSLDPVAVRITALRQTAYPDLSEKYENFLPHPCDVALGTVWISRTGERPETLCPAAWETLEKFVVSLSSGGGNFYGNWMKDPRTALISCNDGFRPMSFLLEAVSDDDTLSNSK